VLLREKIENTAEKLMQSLRKMKLMKQRVAKIAAFCCNHRSSLLLIQEKIKSLQQSVVIIMFQNLYNFSKSASA